MSQTEEFVKIIFGIRIKQIRVHRKLSLQDVAKSANLSVSYLNEIEKGKKYPKKEKILSLANALDKPYEELISEQLTKSLAPLNKLMETNLLEIFPKDLFGIDYQKMLEFIVQEPVKSHALLSTIIEIARNYELTRDEFYYTTLRSYQELNNNYFESLEKHASGLRSELKITGINRIESQVLQDHLGEKYGIKVDEHEFKEHKEVAYVRYAFSENKKTLYISPSLTDSQKSYVFAKEIGYRRMELSPRAMVSPIHDSDSFEIVYNNFKTSYFAGAVLIEKEAIINDIRRIIMRNNWDDQMLIDTLQKYTSSPELFMHRLTNILPTFFNLKNLFFLRFEHTMGSSDFDLNKELHLNTLHHPHGNGLGEHYCRRWISIRLLEDLEFKRKRQDSHTPIAGVQISKFHGSSKEYFVLSMARPKIRTPRLNTSLTIGFLLTENVKDKIKFWNDPSILVKTVNVTCERCPISNCNERAQKARLVEKSNNKEKVMEIINDLLE